MSGALLMLSLTVAGAIESRSHWDDAHRLILTERRSIEDGVVREETVLGGTVDGITMIQLPLFPNAAPWLLNYVPTVNDHGHAIAWRKSCAFIRPGTHSPASLPVDDQPILSASLGAWVSATRGCGYLQLELEAREDGEVGFDHVNRIVVREQSWCVPAHGSTPQLCHPAGEIGLTTLFFRNDEGQSDDGEILDADIELNDVDYALAVCEADGGCATTGSGTHADLQNTLTHELGHLTGLAHTCQTDATPAVDDLGHPVPPCNPVSALPASITGAVMFAIAAPGEISKRVLSSDDVAGFCADYPLAADPHDCSEVGDGSDAGTPDGGTGSTHASGCGCAAVGGAEWWALLSACGVAARSRNRRCAR